MELNILAAFLLFFPGCAYADAGDDFSNNLFSDLAPVLALFGERVTMQFMSEAMGWADCVILAMAPIGIITIIVAAIRVSGPLWLRAVIGRARENKSAAEMDLMSSTSEEVCELFNGQDIVRCQGKPKIWEFILLFRKREVGTEGSEAPTTRVLTLAQALESGVITDGTDRTGWRMFWQNISTKVRRARRRLKKSFDAETGSNMPPVATRSRDKWDITIIRDITPSAPNMTLNRHDQISRVQIHVIAAFSSVLQAAVLAFFGVITLDAQNKSAFLKDDNPAEDAAFCLAVSGTVLLVLGLFICAHVVEASTEEKRFKTADERDVPQMVWIQCDQTVGDQVFKPFATLPSSKRTIMTTSRRRTAYDQGVREATTSEPSADAATVADDSEKVNVATMTEERPCVRDHNAKSSRQWFPILSSRFGGRLGEIKTVAGTSVSLAGFVVQFVGLRRLNWAASVAQLGAVLIMAAARAWVRRGLSQRLVHRELSSGFELEWLAMTLSGVNHDCDPCFDFLSAGSTTRSKHRQRRYNKPPTLSIMTGSGHNCRQLATVPERDLTTNTSRPQTMLIVHRELSKLAESRGRCFDVAIRLANCIEYAMEILLPCQFTEQSSLIWPIQVHHGMGDAPQWISVQLARDKDSGKWKAFSDELASVISLWVCSSREAVQEAKALDTRREFNHLNKNDDTWLRETVPRSSVGLKRLGPDEAGHKQRLLQDLQWWVPDDLGGIIEVEETSTVHGENLTSALTVDGSRVVGVSMSITQGTADRLMGQEGQRTFRQSNIRLEQQRAEKWCSLETNRVHMKRLQTSATATLAIPTFDELEVLYAKALLSSFIRSVAKTMDLPMAGQTEMRPPLVTWDVDQRNYKVLSHDGINRLTQHIQENRLGSSLEAFLSIISPLSLEERLPHPQAFFDRTLFQINQVRRDGELLSAYTHYQWLWEQCREFHTSRRSIFACAATCLMEYRKDLYEENMIRERIQYGTGLDLDLWGDRLISGSDMEDILSRLSNFRDYQRPPGPRTKDKTSPRISDNGPEGAWAEMLGITESHREAMSCVHNDAQPDLLRLTRFKHHRDATGWTVVHYLAANNLSALLYDLCDESVINQGDVRGWTPLHYACRYGCEGAVEVLISLGADIACRGIDGVSPFHCATKSDNIEVLAILVTSQKSLERQEQSYSPGDAAESLQDHNGRAPIHWAVLEGNLEAIKVLKGGMELKDKQGMTALHMAILCNSLEAVRALLQHSASAESRNFQGRTSLHMAAYRGKPEILKLLVDDTGHSGTDLDIPDDMNKTPLHIAAELGGEEKVKILLGEKASLEVRDNGYATPLHLAAMCGQWRSTKDEKDDADLDQPMSIEAGSVQVLINAKADIHAKDNHGLTPLLRAASRHRAAAFTCLLDNGAKVEAVDNDQKTALHYLLDTTRSRQATHVTVIRRVCQEFPHLLHARDATGKTPLDVARESKVETEVLDDLVKLSKLR